MGIVVIRRKLIGRDGDIYGRFLVELSSCLNFLILRVVQNDPSFVLT
jgi:hypothetical protein